ncbi:hypothetical protein KQX54_002524 [Cotesia glomerata]|uniref:Uncharacterized protein n=1 Tax=Cotesia glomerata TaxID=32391 RepID=A0AAV7IFH8_COTGL|nr:hypothetical protein KQX54_002524 [Cotesia glomerata]
MGIKYTKGLKGRQRDFVLWGAVKARGPARGSEHQTAVCIDLSSHVTEEGTRRRGRGSILVMKVSWGSDERKMGI